MHESSSPDGYWPYALKHATLIHNILPNRKHDNRQSPHEAMFGNKPDVGQIRVWGKTAMCTGGSFGFVTLTVSLVAPKGLRTTVEVV